MVSEIAVSVIIPIYNAEMYLDKCLESVINQSLKDIEIICVNDGSTDGSDKILSRYAKRDSRIKVLSQINSGAMVARNNGLKVATGKYIGYVDSDDWIEPTLYERLYKEAVQNQADLVTSGYFLEGNYTTIHLDTLEAGVYKGDNIQYLRNNTIYRLDKKETGLRATLCSKLFSKELITKTQFSISDRLTMAEDKMCLLKCVLESKVVIVVKEAYYHYRINANSFVHTPNPDYLLSVNEVYQCLLGMYTHPCFTREMRRQAELYIIELLLKGINTLMGFSSRNLLWIDPYWLDKIPLSSKIVLYGGGELGIKYKEQILNRKDLSYLGCVDFGYEKFVASAALKVQSPQVLSKWNYDYIVITIKNQAKVQQVKARLADLGISDEKILWFEQLEIFWKYAEADGLLNVAEEEIVEIRETDNRQISEN